MNSSREHEKTWTQTQTGRSNAYGNGTHTASPTFREFVLFYSAVSTSDCKPKASKGGITGEKTAPKYLEESGRDLRVFEVLPRYLPGGAE